MGIRCLSGGRKHKGKTKEFGQRNETEGQEGEVEYGMPVKERQGREGRKEAVGKRKGYKLIAKRPLLPE